MIRLARGRTLPLAFALPALLVAGIAVAPSAAVAAEDRLSIVKTADPTVVEEGQPVTFTIQVSCTDYDTSCENAVVTDLIPDVFAIDGDAAGSSVRVNPAGTVTGKSVSGQTVTVNLSQIAAGSTTTIEIPVQLREGLPYSANGVAVTNTATVTADDSIDKSDTADVTPVVALSLGATASKDITPASALTFPGLETLITLGAANHSNTGADAITIQDPSNLDAGFLSSTSNPWHYLSPAAEATVTALPENADQAQLSFYVEGAWVDGPVTAVTSAPATIPAPASVTDLDAVDAVRIVFSNSTGATIAANATAEVTLAATQNELVEELTDDLTITNTVEVTLAAEDETSAPATASDTYTLSKGELEVEAEKSFSPSSVVVGGSTTMTLIGTNASDKTVTSLVLVDRADGQTEGSSMFTDGAVLTGWGDTIQWPAGATAVEVSLEYVPAGGGAAYTAGPVTGTTPNQLPALPEPEDENDTLVGFRIEFTGTMPAGASARVSAVVELPEDESAHTDANATAPGTQWANVLQVRTAIEEGPDTGWSGVATDSARVTSYDPHLEVIPSKQISPDMILGEKSNGAIVMLTAQIAPFPETPEDAEDPYSTVGATEVVLQDPVDPTAANDWWETFSAARLAQVSIPSNASLTVSYWSYTEEEWIPFASASGAMTSIINTEIPASIREDVGGLKFVFTANPGETFAPGAALHANYVAVLREEATTETLVENTFSTIISNPDEGVSDSGSATADLTVLPAPHDGEGDLIEKVLRGETGGSNPATVPARNLAKLFADLHWSTGGYQNLTEVWITDTASPETTPLANGMYDAFNLVRVAPITAAMDPLLAYDRVVRVELWNGTEWYQPTNDPCRTTPSNCYGKFPGFTLSGADQEIAQGVRLVFAESPVRASVVGSDPTLPLVGSGVATSMNYNRLITLEFQARDWLRSDATVAVTGQREYNWADQEGWVINTTSATGYVRDGEESPLTQIVRDVDSDEVRLIDQALNATVVKTWEQDGPIALPPADLDPALWPSGLAKIVATNATAARVDQLTIVDPILTANVLCAAQGATTTASPFDYFNLAQITSITVPGGADATKTRIVLLRGSAEQEFTGSGAIASVKALTKADLEDVTGIIVEFNGRISRNATSTIEYTTQLRQTVRGTDEPTTTGVICNVAQASVVDAGGLDTENPTAQAADVIEIRDVGIDIDVQKTVTPTPIVEPSTGPATITLRGRPVCVTDEVEVEPGVVREQCVAFSRATELSLTDIDPRFWNQYDFSALQPIRVHDAGFQVRVDAVVGGTFELDGDGAPVVVGGDWVVGSFASAAGTAGSPVDIPVSLPAGVDPEDVQGLRFTFSRIDGAIWEHPNSPWMTATFTAERRDTLHIGADGATNQPVASDMAGNAPAPGETAAGAATNTVLGHVTAADRRDNGEGQLVPVTADDSATAPVVYRHANHSVRIDKRVEAQKSISVPVGTPLTYTIAVTNNGSTAIVDPVITDRLPLDAAGGTLQFDPAADPTGPGPFSYALTGTAPSPASGTAMPVNPEEVTVEVTPNATNGLLQELAFIFPAGTVIEVGQTYTITMALTMRPGLPVGTYVNTAGVVAERPWDNCNGTTRAVATWAPCESSATVGVTGATALLAQKYVAAGEGPDLGVFSTVAGQTCEEVATGLAAGHYAPPCVPRTAPGQDEQWVLVFTNTGNFPQSQVVAYDRLPRPGDTGAINLGPRGSQWRPILSAVPTLQGAPAGATLVTEYVSDATPGCTGNLVTACANDAWTVLPEDADEELLATVRALRFTVDFATGNEFLGAAQFAIVMTTTTPAYAPTLATDSIAYSTVASYAVAAEGRGQTIPAEGLRVGVALATRSLEVEKVVEGEFAELAPETFDLTVVCTSLGEEVPLGAARTVTVTPGTAATIQGIPFGSTCEVEPDLDATPTHFSSSWVTLDDTPGEPIRVIATNAYLAGGIVLTKTVESDAVDENGEPVAFGPFEFEVRCTFLGEPVAAAGYTLGGDDQMTVTLEGPAVNGETLQAELTHLPAKSICEVEEVDSDGAASTTWVVTTGGETAEPQTGAAVELEVAVDRDGESTNLVEVTNAYPSGELEITKTVTGDAAEFATGPYSVEIECVYGEGDNERVVFADQRVLGGENPLTATIPLLPNGATCVVEEIEDGGATTTEVTGSPATIVADATAEVGVENVFKAGSIVVTKIVDGEGVELYGAGPFEFLAECVFEGNPIEVPGGATREVSAGETASWDGLPVGADCVVTETRTGGASSTLLTVVDGEADEPGVDDDAAEPNVGDAATGVAVTVRDEEVVEIEATNTFALTSLLIEKRLAGDTASHISDEFEFALSCTVADGAEGILPVEIPGGATRVLSADTGWVATFDLLPVGAECEVVETVTGDANATTWQLVTTEGAVDGEGTTVTVVLDENGADLTVTNEWTPAVLGQTGPWIASLLAALAAILLALGAVLVTGSVRRGRTAE